MTERAQRYAIRAVLLAAAAAAVTAELAARVVMPARTTEHLALLVFLPLLIVPGAVAWKRPTPRVLAFWSLWGWAATAVWHALDYRVAVWPVVHFAVWTAIAIVTLAGALVWLVVRRDPRGT